MIKEMKKMWNDGIDRGFTVFQWFLIMGMAVAAFQNNKFLLLGCLFFLIIGFFEPVKTHDAPGEDHE